MATQSVSKNYNGPFLPAGLIVVATPGTPVNIMSLLDSTNANDPNTATGTSSREYTITCQTIYITACKAGASHGLAVNTGNIYVLLAKQGAGAGNRDDYGSMLFVLPQGAATAGPFPSLVISAAALNLDVFSPYRLFIDADNASDGALVTLGVQ